MASLVAGRAELVARPAWGAAARVGRRVSLLLGVLVGLLMAGSSVAFASTTTTTAPAPASSSAPPPADPTGGVFTSAQSQFSQYIIPGAVGIVLLVLVFGVAVMWARRTAKRS